MIEWDGRPLPAYLADSDEGTAFAAYVNKLCERLSICLAEAGYPVEEIRLGFPVEMHDDQVGEGQLSVILVDHEQNLPDEVLARALHLAVPGELVLGERLVGDPLGRDE